VTGSNGKPYEFIGREDDRNGLYFYRARCNSAALQRFIAQLTSVTDPLSHTWTIG
jgi:hypothetical protein